MGLVHHTNIVTDGLIGCWDVGNRKSYPGTGDDWGDLVNSVTATGETSVAPLFSSEPWAGTFLLDGTDDYFAIPDADLEVVGAFTFSVWLRFTTATPAGAQGYVVFTIRGGSGWDAEFALSILNHSWISQSVRVGCKGLSSQMGRWNANKYSPNENYNVWRNYCGVYNGSDPDVAANFKFYFDGVDAGTHDAQYNWGVTNNETRWAKDGADYGYMGGYLGTIHLHNRALTAAEIKQNYEAVKPRFVPRITKRGMNLNFDAGDPASYAGGTTTWKDTANGLTTTFHNMDASNFNSSNGGYFDFDGTDEWMTVPYSPLFQGAIADQGTFAAWFNIDEAGDDSDPNVPIWGAGTNGSKMTWTMFQYDSDKKLGFGAKLGGSWTSPGVTDSALSYDTWYYVVFTWDKANTQVKSYINGALDDTDSTSSASITTSTAGALGIGASLYNRANTGTPWAFLSGFIGVLQLYDSVLSAGEVLDNYNKTKARFGH